MDKRTEIYPVTVNVSGKQWSKKGLSQVEFKKKDASTQTEQEWGGVLPPDTPSARWMTCNNDRCSCRNQINKNSDPPAEGYRA